MQFKIFISVFRDYIYLQYFHQLENVNRGVKFWGIFSTLLQLIGDKHLNWLNFSIKLFYLSNLIINISEADFSQILNISWMQYCKCMYYSFIRSISLHTNNGASWGLPNKDSEYIQHILRSIFLRSIVRSPLLLLYNIRLLGLLWI